MECADHAEKCKQTISKMRQNKCSISESYWIQFGQKSLQTGDEIIYLGRDQGQQREIVALLRKTAQKIFCGWETHGFIFLSANKRININIALFYAPTNRARDEEKSEFYNRQQGMMEKLPSNYVNKVIGEVDEK